MAFVSSFAPLTKHSSSLNQSAFTQHVRSSHPRVAELPSTVAIPTCPKTPKNAPVRMLFGFNPFATEVVALPQHDPENASKRKAEIEKGKEDYVWNRNLIAGSPMIDGFVRASELPSVTWIEGILQTVFRILSNAIAERVGEASDAFKDETSQLFAKIGSILASTVQLLTLGIVSESKVTGILEDVGNLFKTERNAEGTGNSLQDYKDLYRVYPLDKVAQSDQFLRDDIFGWYRVAGPSPMRIRKFEDKVEDVFPEMTNEILRGISKFGADSIEEIVAENRLFYVEYKEFDGVQAGYRADGTKKEGWHVYAPTALLAVPKANEIDDRTTILPIAIRCEQSREYPMYTPNTAHTDDVTWLAAKLTVQVADGLMHGSVYHFGLTHLLLEGFLGSMHRTLAPTHPLHKLMSVHFEGTHLINYLGAILLTAPGGTVDDISAPQIEETIALSSECIQAPKFSFNESSPEKEFDGRGMLHADRLNYPFRDDALKVWPVIKDWVRAYVSAYYKSDKDVVEDYELQSWVREIVSKDGAAVPGFGETADGAVTTVDYVVQFIAHVIYVGSVQHAAVNYTQGVLMQFLPAMPLAGFAPAPKTAKPYKSIDDWVEKMMPDLSVAQLQLNLMEFLSGFQYTQLGEYGRALSFVSDEVDDAANEFKDRLGEIGAEIQARNRKEREAGLPVYNYLVPKNIPNSINL